MNIIWQGKDITKYVTVRKAVARDTCGNRCDGIDIEFENAESWYRWGPEEDDEIRVTLDGWDSGLLYLHTIAPGDGKYRILATALPCRARKREWRSWEGKSAAEILRTCAALTRMEWQTYGIDDTVIIPYIQQENEGVASFLHRVALLEGAKLKCVNGKYTMIGLDWAQDRNPAEKIRIAPDQDNVDYRRDGTTYSRVKLMTPYATGEAVDAAVNSNHVAEEITDKPAMNNIQAARWARNILKEKNRKHESLALTTTFNPFWTAMTRIDVTGGTDADGDWIIEEAEHDLIDLRSKVKMYRCIRSVR